MIIPKIKSMLMQSMIQTKNDIDVVDQVFLLLNHNSVEVLHEKNRKTRKKILLTVIL